MAQTRKPVYAIIGGKSVAFPTIEAKFTVLAEMWEDDQRGQSVRRYDHSAYLQISAMGRAAIPILLERVAGGDTDWIYALKLISGEQAETAEKHGDEDMVIEAWTDWGRRNGYIKSNRPPRREESNRDNAMPTTPPIEASDLAHLLALPAGRELDRAVSERLRASEDFRQGWDPYANGPAYSTDIAAAWRLHTAYCRQVYSRRLRYALNLQAAVSRRVLPDGLPRGETAHWESVITSMGPLDICRAALMSGSPVLWAHDDAKAVASGEPTKQPTAAR